MEEILGKIFPTGQTVPETGQYQLQGDNTKPDIKRVDTGRVMLFKEGEAFPAHPDTGQRAEWRFIRVSRREGHVTQEALIRQADEE